MKLVFLSCTGNQEVKYDLESSGSGFGPDDEDGDGGKFLIALAATYSAT